MQEYDYLEVKMLFVGQDYLQSIMKTNCNQIKNVTKILAFPTSPPDVIVDLSVFNVITNVPDEHFWL